MAAGRSHVDLFQTHRAVLPLSIARKFLLYLFLFVLPCALSEFVPTAPGPGDAFIAGNECTLEWDTDTGGSWDNVTIDLMSGSNDNMTVVTNVVVGLDGTDSRLSPFTWICPEVNPYSSIYFYQFAMSGNKTVKWTTRFAIAAPNGDLWLPKHSRQPNGDEIPWGVGHLVANSSQQLNSSRALPSSVCNKHATNFTSHELILGDAERLSMECVEDSSSADSASKFIGISTPASQKIHAVTAAGPAERTRSATPPTADATKPGMAETEASRSSHYSEDTTASDLNSPQTASSTSATTHPSPVSASGNALFTGTSSAGDGQASQRSCAHWVVPCAVAAMWLVD